MITSSSLQKKLILAVCASIAFTCAPIARGFTFTWKHAVGIGAGALILRLITKEGSKDPVTFEKMPVEFRKALADFRKAKSRSERKKAWTRLVAILDDALIGFSGKKKGYLVTGDEGKVYAEFSEMAPYGLLGTFFAYLKPAAKEADTLLKIAATAVVLNAYCK